MKVPMLTLRKLLEFYALGAGMTPAEGSENKLILFKNNVEIDLDTVVEDLEEADFLGYSDIDVPADSPLVLTDPVDGQPVMLPAEPADGYQFVTTEPMGTTFEAQTIYGWAVVNNGKTQLHFGDNFDEPILLTEAGQFISVAQPVMKITATAIS